MKLNFYALLISVLSTTSGCSVLIGNVKPVGEKSESYQVLRLDQSDPNWLSVDTNSSQEKDDKEVLESSDLAYQSQRSSSIISLNSSCRRSLEHSPRSLRQFTDALLLGIREIELRQERELKLDGSPALETTLQGTLGQRTSRIRTIVVKKGMCVYDFMLIARIDRFGQDLPTFEKFTNSFKFNP
jgi:hypothetical protein